MNKAKHAPLFHISKRKSMPWYKNWAVRGVAILLAVAVAAIVTMIMTGDNPGRIFLTMIDGAFGTPRRRWMTAQEVAILHHGCHFRARRGNLGCHSRSF